MKNILLKFINNHTKCHHKNALLYQDEGYCPDCGQYLVKNYYIIRCARCDVKREAKLFWGEIVPQEKFCTNCGARDYYIEKLDKVNFVDARYAIYLKEVVSDLVMENVEALATGEVIVGPWYCVGNVTTCLSDGQGTIKGVKHYI